MARIGVFGIGNVLMGDDAVGPYVVRVFEAQHEVGDDVQVLDAGTPGLDLTAYFADLEAVVIVDAVKAKAPAGEVRVYDKETLTKRSPILAVSPHEPGVREAILNAEFMGCAPRVVRLVGVMPASVDYRLGLTAEVLAAVPVAVARVVEELRALGAEVRPRAPARAPDLWWEKKPGA